MNYFKSKVRFSVLLFILVAISLMFNGIGLAQEEMASMNGTVVDDQDQPLPGATITLTNTETGFQYFATSIANGNYLVSGIKPGVYNCEVTLTSFSRVVREKITLSTGSRITINFSMQPGTLEETVTVTAETPMIEITKAEISTVVDRREIDNLPLRDRDWDSLTITTPGVLEGRSNAMPSGMGEMLVDGVSNENVIDNWVRMPLPADAIQEFRVLTNQYAVEYGNAAGMLRSAITRSGTNQITGRISGYYRDEAFDTPNYFVDHEYYQGPKLENVKLPDYSHWNFSGFLGGPIAKDKAHFFLAYDGLFTKHYETIIAPMVERTTVSVPEKAHNILAKIDYRPSEKHHLTGRYTGYIVKGENAEVGGYNTMDRAQDKSVYAHEFQFNWNFYISSSTMNQLRLFYAPDGYDMTTADPSLQGQYTIDHTDLGNYGPSEEDSTWSKRYQIIDNFSIYLGDHSIKLGFDYAYCPAGATLGRFYPGVYEFATPEPFDANNPLTYPFMFMRNIGDKTFSIPNHIGAIFAQDTWRISPRVTLNYGLRYNYFNVEGLDLKNGIENLNPRIGLSWDATGDGKTVVRGGIGTYSSNVMTGSAFMYILSQKMLIQAILYPNYPDPNTPNPWWPLMEEMFGMTPGFLTSQENLMRIGDYEQYEDLSPSRNLQITLGLQREVVTDLTLGGDLIWARGYGLMRLENLNPGIPGTGGETVDPTRGEIWITTDKGTSEYRALYFTLNKRYSRGWSLEMNYTLSWSKSDIESGDGNELDHYDDPDWIRQYGYTNNDARHKLSLTGIFDLPWGFQLSSIFFYRSAFPWTAYYGYVYNGDGLRSDYIDQHRNERRGFDYLTLDARISKFFNFGSSKRLHLFFEVYNLTNRTNFTGIASNQTNPFFGNPEAAFDPRLIQIGVRFDFF